MILLPSCIRRLARAALLLLTTACLLGLAPVAQAQYVVTATTDTGIGSGTSGDLRYCIAQANAVGGFSAITFDPTLFASPQTIVLNGSDSYHLNANITITGPAVGVTLDGQNLNRILLTHGGTTSTISHLNFRNGQVYSANNVTGGALYNNGSITVNNCTFVHNFANGGGAIENVGGASNTSDGNLTLNSCTFDGNSTTTNNNTGVDIGGGAIYNYGENGDTAALVVYNCTFTNNSCLYYGGAIYNDGGSTGTSIGNATVILTGCTLSGNDTNGEGGAIYNNGNGGGNAFLVLDSCVLSGNASSGGGAIFNMCSNSSYNTGFSSLRMLNCVLSNNSGNYGGAIYNEGFSYSSGSGGLTPTSLATLTNCTLSGNNSRNYGGAIVNEAVGQDNTHQASAPLSLTNCTLADNVSQQQNTGGGGAIYNSFGPYSDADITLTNSTLSQNSAGASGGAIYIANPGGKGSEFNIANTIISGNTAPIYGPDIYTTHGGLASGGYNLIGSLANSGFNATPTDIIGQDPKLAPLGNYGGFTQTMALLPGSPAIDQIPSSVAYPDTDQRGVPRPQGAAADIGAYEYAPAASLALSPASGSQSVGSAFPISVTAYDQFGNLIPGAPAPLIFSSSDQRATLPTSASSTMTFGSSGTQTLTVSDGQGHAAKATFFVTSGPGKVLVNGITVSRRDANTVVVVVSLLNPGTTTANNVQFTRAALGGHSPDVLPGPVSLTSGGTATVRLTFSGVPSGPQTFTVGGSYTGGFFSSGQRVNVP